VLPIELGPVNARSHSVRQRFIKASIGWTRYKPLLTRLTQPEKYDSTIEDMREKLDSVIPKLSKYFDTNQFGEIRTELDRYDRNVRHHHRSFEATKKAWTKISRMFLPVSFLTAFLTIPF
ncbi:MAG: hypothetical protein ABI539_05500, partial [Acidobacteriota bacterium]